MKKFFSMMLIAAAALSFAACEPENSQDKPSTGTKLEAPAPTAEAGETYIVVSWEAISGADSYTLNLKGKNYTTSETTYTFENLNKGDYTIRVKATGEGYKDSDFGTVTVTVTGATSVDWFTQTATARAEEVAIDFTWIGEGVASLSYAIFTTESASQVDESTIIANLDDLNAEGLAAVNSAEGLTAYFDQGLYGSTSYTLFAYVTNEAGISFLAKNEVVTCEAKVSDEAAAWLGNWAAYTEQIAAYDSNAGTFNISNQRNDIAMEIVMQEGTTHDVIVYGLSKIGHDIPAFGTVALAEDGTNVLYIWSFQNLGDVGNGYYAYWISYCSLADGGYTFVTGEFPAWMLCMDAAGNVTCEMYTGELSNGAIFTAQATEVFALNPETGQLGFMSLDEQGTPNNVLNYGPMKGIEKAAAAQSVAAPATLKAANVAVAASVVAK